MDKEGDKNIEIKNRFVKGIGVCIELPKKIVYLDIDKSDLSSEWLPSIYFADWLDTSKTVITRIINKLGIVGEFNEALGELIYPPLTFEMISEEYKWLQKYKSLDNKLTPLEMGDILDRDYRYITKVATGLGYKLKDGKFLKSALIKIRDNELLMPFDEGWYTLRHLAIVSGKDREWVANRLEVAGINPEKRKSFETGIIHDYYPPETLNYIAELIREIPKYGQDWYTLNRIIQETNKSRSWVSKRLNLYDEEAEDRLDDMGVSRKHYPFSVFNKILAEAEPLLAKSDSDGWLTIKEISIVLGISEKSVYRKLDDIGFKYEIRKSVDGKSIKHYSLSDINKIIREENNYINESTLSRKIGKSVYWICKRLEEMGVPSKMSRYSSSPGKLYHKRDIPIRKLKEEAKSTINKK